MKHFRIHSLIIIVVGVLLVSLSSCLKDTAGENEAQENSLIATYIQSHQILTQPTADGLYFIPQTEGTGTSPVAYDYIYYDYIASDINDDVYDCSNLLVAQEHSITLPLLKNGGPRLMQMNALYFPMGLIEAFSKMKPGGSAKLIIPSKLWNYDYNPRVYYVTLQKVVPNMQTYEHSQIQGYLDTCLLNINVTHLTLADSTKTGNTGVYYLESLAGTGSTPVVGDSIHVSYKARTVDGIYFDQGTDYKTILGNGNTIPGFEEGVKHMKLGGKATIIVPYRLGYSYQYVTNSSNQIILQPFSTLVFDVTLTALKH